MKTFLIMIGTWIEALSAYLSGREDAGPINFRFLISSSFWGIWWGFLLIIVLIFSGQSSRFIYIDF